MRRVDRRSFLKGIAGAAGAVAGMSLPAVDAFGAILGANERFRIAVCGVNGRGSSHIGGFRGLENVQVPFLVDPDEQVLARRVREHADKIGSAYEIRGETDVRSVLERDDVDAI
ncbi:MAG TPA: twin-arginine translocation signal domain-containing protein, partial [Planctomycetota bacterium]|nr:twin-arginine translocation signal domain-containing protein [Planctomycetota bacterium]